MSSKQEFKKVANKRDFQKANLLRVEPDGKPIVLSMVDSKIYAMNAICTHEGAPLQEGNLQEYSLTCPWHYAVFDVRNGKVSDATVWATDLKSYPVEVEENTGDILVNPNGTDDDDKTKK